MSVESERIYTINLGKALLSPNNIRAKRAINMIREFARHHMKRENIMLDTEVSQYIWRRGIRHPPRKIRVGMEYQDRHVRVYLYDEAGQADAGTDTASTLSEPDEKSASLDSGATTEYKPSRLELALHEPGTPDIGREPAPESQKLEHKVKPETSETESMQEADSAPEHEDKPEQKQDADLAPESPKPASESAEMKPVAPEHVLESSELKAEPEAKPESAQAGSAPNTETKIEQAQDAALTLEPSPEPAHEASELETEPEAKPEPIQETNSVPESDLEPRASESDDKPEASEEDMQEKPALEPKAKPEEAHDPDLASEPAEPDHGQAPQPDLEPQESEPEAQSDDASRPSSEHTADK